MGKFNPGDWVQIEDVALGLKAIGCIIKTMSDHNFNLYYSIEWKIVECRKSQGISPTSLYPMADFDKKGCLAANAQVLYGSPPKV